MDSSTYLERLFADSHLVELRHHTGSHWEFGVFDDIDALRRAVLRRENAGALYTSLNRINRDSARVTNAVAPQSIANRAVKNEDIAVVTRIPFDFDPERPTGTNSTEAELKRAIECRDMVVQALRALGWPMPLLAISGNGAHAVFRTNIKPDAAWREGSAVLYQAISNQFHDLLKEHGVKFDPVVRNPGRIWRLYGTLNRKGAPTPERPHRTATCTLPAGAWQIVTPRQVQAVVDAWRPAVVKDETIRERQRLGNFRPGTGDYKTLDIVALFQAYGFYRRQLDDHTHAVRCPWADQHSTKGGTSDTVIFEARDGWPGFYCHHAHCQGRNIKDVIQLFGDVDRFCARQFEKGGRTHG